MADSDGNSMDASLFEGMVLFSPSDLSPSSSSPPAPSLPTPSESLPPSPSPSPSPPPPPLSSSSASISTSMPLDEDLFADLTLLTPAPPVLADLNAGGAPTVPEAPPAIVAASDGRISHPLPPARQASRKKKRAFRVGYARESLAPSSSVAAALPASEVGGSFGAEEEQAIFSSSNSFGGMDSYPIPGLELKLPEAEEEQQHPSPPVDSEGPIPLDDSEILETEPEEGAHCEENGAHLAIEDKSSAVELSGTTPCDKEDTFAMAEEKLQQIRAKISQRLEQIQMMALDVSIERKELVRRRRKAAEDVSSASIRYKHLERELEEACEAEDFERAESVSDSLATAEKEKDVLLSKLREAEAQCDSLNSMMQEILEMQIAAEEECVNLLEQFADSAAGDADLILKNAEEYFAKEIEEWNLKSENFEIKKMEVDVELRLLDEARLGLETSIQQSVQDDKKEREILSMKKDMLAKELNNLLALVKLKEEEIAETNLQIEEVDKRISDVMNNFQESQSNVDVRYNAMQSDLSRIESECETLFMRKKSIDERLTLAEETNLKLKELARISNEEAWTHNDLILLRKSLASPNLKLMDKKASLARKQESILEDVQVLRQQVSVSRASLQELSLNRSSLLEEISSSKQRISFIDKRAPELEAEKKVAAAARNFKEAGRIAAEARTLSLEKDTVQSKIEKAAADLEVVEEKIKNFLNKIQEGEGLIVSKEKEAARAGCERLRLVAAAARAERFASLALDDIEEGDILLQEAEAAESKAKELQKEYDLDLEVLEKAYEDHSSLALITVLAGKQLAEMASSLKVHNST